MNEATKTRALLTAAERSLLRGKGIDIGCGADPITQTCRRFDVDDGDANHVTAYVKEPGSFDYVASIHSLEHMNSPEESLQDWWTLLKPGGILLLVVPDEDLYEQGYWPSVFNPDHKSTFTISKQTSWSPVSRNLLDLAKALPGAEVLSLRLQDQSYDRGLLFAGLWPNRWAGLSSYLRSRMPPRATLRIRLLQVLYVALRLPVDQTFGEATAQILVLLRKALPRAGTGPAAYVLPKESVDER
jgi:SAM-dependent methyltransferase